LKLEAHGATHVGRQRSTNEDVFVIDPEFGLYLVCDGMGGHAAGEVAAKTASEEVVRTIRKERDLLDRIRRRAEPHVELQGLVESAVQAAGKRVHERATSDPDYAGMGCTLTLLLITGSRAAFASVGDTRLYLDRDGATEQLSTDHTMADFLVKRGDLTPTQARASRYAHVLTQALGLQEAVKTDTLILDVLPDDTYLLCSDGLSRYLEGLGELSALLSGTDLKGLPKRLVDLANQRGGADNVSAVVVRATATDAEHQSGLVLTHDTRTILDVLRSVELFQDIPFAGLLRLRNIAEIRSYRSNDVVIQEGATCDRLFLALTGRFALERNGGSVEALARTEHVGITTLLVPRVCHATLRCVDDGQLLVLTGRNFMRLARIRPWLGVALLSRLARTLSKELAAHGEGAVRF